MRKLILMLLGVAMALAACNKAEESDVADAKEAVYTLTVNANDGIETRGGEVIVSEDGYTTRYILEIYHSSSNELYQRIVQYQGQAGVATPNEFNFRLVTNQQYEFLVWIDYAKNETPAADLHYNTQNLKNIAVMGDYINNDPTRDAFCGNSTVNMVGTSQTFDAITCKRPFGQLNIATTDWNHVKNAPALLPTAVQIKYQGYSSFNVSSGVPVDGSLTNFVYRVNDIATKQKLIGNATNEGVQKLTCDYLFASAEGFNVDSTKITFYNRDGNEITHTGADLANLPIKRNYKTNVSGNLLTKKGDITVKVDAEWENDLTIETLEDAIELQQAMNNAAGNLDIYYFMVNNKVANATGGFNIDIPANLNSAKEIHIIFGEDIERNIVINRNPTYSGKLYVKNNKKGKGFTCNNLGTAGELIVSGNWTSTYSRSKITTIDIDTNVDVLRILASNVVYELNGRVVNVLGIVKKLEKNTTDESYDFSNKSIELNLFISKGGNILDYTGDHSKYFDKKEL